jgi:hypothetical protein
LTILKFSEFSIFTSVIESRTRSANIIWDNLIWTINALKISFFIFSFMRIFLCAEWASTKIIEWLCLSLTIFKNQASLFSFYMTTTKKEHWMRLLTMCRRFWSLNSFDFRSRSHINHVFLRTFNLNFLIRFMTIAWSRDSAFSFILRIKFFRFSKNCSSSKKTREIKFSKAALRFSEAESQNNEISTHVSEVCELTNDVCSLTSELWSMTSELCSLTSNS